MTNKKLGFFSLASLLGSLALPLGGCDTVAETGCSTNAECAANQTCSSGSCVPVQTGTAGSGGGFNTGTSGSGFGGSSSSSAGSAPVGGTLAVGGTAGLAGASGSSSTSGGSLNNNGGSGNHGGAGSSGGSGSSAGSSSGGSGGGDSTVVGQCKDDYWPAANNGSVTRYDFRQGTQLPACAYVITHTGSGSDGDWDTVEGISTGDGGYFGAMNTADYAQGAACGACVEASYNGRKVVLTIVDECPVGSNPVCQKGHIDLSRKAIRQLEPNSSLEDLKNVSWHYVKCPATGNVKARLHPSQTADWKPVVIENGLYPLKSVTLNGTNATRSGNNQGGNAWIASGQKPPYVVHATDVNGDAVTFNYAGGSDLKDVGLQFSCK